MDITVSIYTEEKKTITYLIKKYKCHKYLKILIIFLWNKNCMGRNWYNCFSGCFLLRIILMLYLIVIRVILSKDKCWRL